MTENKILKLLLLYVLMAFLNTTFNPLEWHVVWKIITVLGIIVIIEE